MNTLLRKTLAEVATAQEVLEDPEVQHLLKRIILKSRSLSAEEQQELSKKLAEIPITKSSAFASARRSSRSGKYFDKFKEATGKKNYDPESSDEPKGKDQEEPAKEPLSDFEDGLKNSQQFKLYTSQLNTTADPVARANSVFNILKDMPGQNDLYSETLRKLLSKR